MGADCDLTTLLAAIATADDAYPHAVDLQVRSASLQDGRVDLDLSVLTEGKILSSWRVACHGVVENRVALGEVGFELDAQHVLLLDHHEGASRLYHTSAGIDPVEARAALCRAHDGLMGGWRPLSQYVNAMPLEQVLSHPSGSVACGPVTLLARYQEALEACGGRTRMELARADLPYWVDVPSHRLVDPHPVIVLILDRVEPGETEAGSYVIAESFSARAL